MSFDRVTRSVESSGKGLRIVYRHSGTGKADPQVRALDEFSVRELAALAGLSSAEADALCDRTALRVLCNGWQSWAAGWELEPGERQKPIRFKRKKLSLFLDRPGDMTHRGRKQWAGPLGRRADLRSHFFIVLRAGRVRLALISANGGTAPVGFGLSRSAMRLRVDLGSGGCARANGDLLAELRVVAARDWFSLKDALAEIFAPQERFARLAFLAPRSASGFRAGGWESWYHHYASIDQDLVEANLEALGSNGNWVNAALASKGGPAVFQVDDGWEIAIGDWDFSRERFPSGMERLAGKIAAKGLVPGIWVAPFVVSCISRIYQERPEWLLRDKRGRPVRVGWIASWEGYFYALDLSREDVRAYLDELFDRIVNEWGYRFIKLDFLYAGLFPGKREAEGPAWKCYAEALKLVTKRERSRSGEPVAYLGCGAPLELSWRELPLMRIGADTLPAWDNRLGRLARYQGRPSAYVSLKDSIGRALLNRTAFASDPDVFFLRDCGLSRTEKELIALADFLFGSLSMVSDDLHLFPEGEDASFTERIAGLCQRLEGLEVGAEALARDVYRVMSRGGELEGIINLRDRPWKPGPAWNPGGRSPLVENVRRDKRPLAYERHSISLYLG